MQPGARASGKDDAFHPGECKARKAVSDTRGV
jgi:hypothetical protein